MSILVDIASVVFFGAITWKFKQLQKQISSIKSDLELTMKNPQAAKRVLKERQQ